ncbi:hypothetical protein GMLC_40730 [Geomonas limicola]|uniref:AXH domain-containing protein n=1 Tax=Geomonas limicola TaxID=2740186 RepID=A0A6V8NF96_9BACT|nr:hypothetical protein [Geomonas limicola]GFO70494.1 hypothetical protein GMLC_40730 [Geomonas limicola]
MKCPVCRNQLQTATNLHSEGFTEGITECSVCGAAWSVNHGVTEIIKDPQLESFLEAQTECVEGDDYGLEGRDK